MYRAYNMAQWIHSRASDGAGMPPVWRRWLTHHCHLSQPSPPLPYTCYTWPRRCALHTPAPGNHQGASTCVAHQHQVEFPSLPLSTPLFAQTFVAKKPHNCYYNMRGPLTVSIIKLRMRSIWGLSSQFQRWKIYSCGLKYSTIGRVGQRVAEPSSEVLGLGV